jgi:hypothetical protein
MSNLVPLNDIQQMAEVAAKSRMFGFKNQEEAMAIMLLCQAESLHPAVAMRDYHVIQGRPALKADAMLARFQQAGGSVQWKTYTDAEVTGVFSHPQGGSLEVTWTMEHAKRIGLAGKDNWNKYGRAMLRARAVSEGIRSVYPGCVVGVYTPEEVADFTPAPAKDMGTAERVDIPEPAELVDDGAYALYVPSSPDAYANYHTVDEWIKGYADMSVRISKSKLGDEVKKDKLDALKSCNLHMLDGLDSFQKVKIRALVAEAGVSTNPKLEPSPTSPSSVLNEQES